MGGLSQRLATRHHSESPCTSLVLRPHLEPKKEQQKGFIAALNFPKEIAPVRFFSRCGPRPKDLGVHVASQKIACEELGCPDPSWPVAEVTHLVGWLVQMPQWGTAVNLDDEERWQAVVYASRKLNGH